MTQTIYLITTILSRLSWSVSVFASENGYLLQSSQLGRRNTKSKMIRVLGRKSLAAARAATTSRAYPNSWPHDNPIDLLFSSTRHFSLSVLPDGLDRSSDAFSRNYEAMRGLVDDLQSRVREVSLPASPLVSGLFSCEWLYAVIMIFFLFGRFWPEEARRL